MAVDVEVVGNGRYAGAKSNIGSYGVSEEATPVEGSDSSGGVGQITFTAIDDPARFGSMLLLNDTVKLTDGDRGETQGKITELSSSGRNLSVTATSRLGQLVTNVTADYVRGNLEDAMNYYLGLGGITTGIAIDTSLRAIPVLAPGWSGDLWTKIKELCVSVGAEISLVKGNVVIRPIRGRKALEINNSTEGWSVSAADMAQQVEIVYYDTKYSSSTLMYPLGGWTSDVSIYSVDSGETKVINVPISATPDSVDQPVPQTSVSTSFRAASVYTVIGKDDKVLSPSTWTASGGKVSVAIGADGRSLDITLTGAVGAYAKRSPFRLAMSPENGNDYSTLRIVGSGTTFDRKSVLMPTGADASVTTTDIGVTVDNVFIKDYDAAVNLGINVTGKWATPRRILTISKQDINRPGETTQNYDYATFAQFDAYAAANSLATIADFDAAWTGQKFRGFDAYWYDIVKDDFRFQVFGNAVGARVPFRRAIYRIRSVNITESGVDYTAEADTTFQDFDTSAAETAMTFGSFDASYAGLTFNDFALIPLPNVKPEYDQ